MCTPGYDITLDRFMRVAHLLPRQRGNVAVDNHTFVNALLRMCRTGAPWRDQPERYGKWVTSASGSTAGPGTARQGACSRHCSRSGSSSGPGARHGLHEREGPPVRGRGVGKGGSRSVGVSRGGRNAKVRVVSDSESTLVEIHLSPGDEHDATHGRRSMAALGAFMGAPCPWTARTRGIRPGCRPSRSA